ncbi:MAG: hypothetical protein GWO41_18030 [candidate division Zixibacteria bacterium]|nr:hypothetical protein [candidate division Zixibacteria bacterium]NIR66555.1 hypothetical protein [candidate division Zixibacteria bacterium]NIS48120.1 hypothetical protein [candidate division Zixibacteria bacterium]NIT54591.1 hypothetical protein [candidate division Zixibacteria bacterium]NIU16242.1 hypothetical protein [candidate division Zixibacteria bacterium]
MAWLEIIEVRVMGDNRETLKSQLLDLINDLSKEDELKSVQIYSRVMVETDFSIHLFHDSEKTDTSCSTICSRLEPSLKDFGLVNRTIWIETIEEKDRNEDRKNEMKKE